MNTLTPEQIAKLPKWAQEHVKNLERRTIVAERTLKEYVDNQTPTPIFFDDLVSCGDGPGPMWVRKYVQSDRGVAIEYKGVQVQVQIDEQFNCVQVKWHRPEHVTGDVAMIPTAFQTIRLIAKENLR